MAEVNKIGLMSAQAILAAGQSGPQDPGNGFSDIMKQAAKGGEDAQADLMNMAKSQNSARPQAVSGRTNVKNNAAKDASEQKKAENVRPQQKNVKNTDKAAAADTDQGKIAEEAEALTKELAEKLGVSVEELTAMMEQLGLSLTDLQQSGNMAELLAGLKDITQADIVMSEDMTDLVKTASSDLAASLEQIADELGIDVDELAQQIKDSAQNVQAQPEVFAEVLTEKSGFEAATVEEEPVQELSEAQETDPAAAGQTAESHGAEKAGEHKKDTGSGEKKQDAGTDQAANLVSQTSSNQAPVSAHALESDFSQAQSGVRAREIIDQIAEHVKVSGGGEKLTGIDMMLNPANLGSIRLQLMSDNGVIKGQLTASDEAVRAALESQLSQLRDALVEQGMKVEALEVTVAGHELEQNLDQSGQQAEKQAEDMAARKNPRRILDLNEIESEEEIEAMTDAQRLEVEMMRMGGNRLNFQA